MTKSFSAFPIGAVAFLLPQLLFWWLSPASPARLLIYAVLTLLTLALPLACLLTYWYTDLAKSAAVWIVGGVLQVMVVAVAALLLFCGSSVRTSIFALLTTALVCCGVLIPFIGAALRPQRQGIYPATILEAEDDAAAADVLPEDLPIPTIDQLISRQRVGSQLPPMPTRQQPPPLPHRDR